MSDIEQLERFLQQRYPLAAQNDALVGGVQLLLARIVGDSAAEKEALDRLTAYRSATRQLVSWIGPAEQLAVAEFVGLLNTFNTQIREASIGKADLTNLQAIGEFLVADQGALFSIEELWAHFLRDSDAVNSFGNHEVLKFSEGGAERLTTADRDLYRAALLAYASFTYERLWAMNIVFTVRKLSNHDVQLEAERMLIMASTLLDIAAAFDSILETVGVKVISDKETARAIREQVKQFINLEKPAESIAAKGSIAVQGVQFERANFTHVIDVIGNLFDTFALEAEKTMPEGQFTPGLPQGLRAVVVDVRMRIRTISSAVQSGKIEVADAAKQLAALTTIPAGPIDPLVNPAIALLNQLLFAVDFVIWFELPFVGALASSAVISLTQSTINQEKVLELAQGLGNAPLDNIARALGVGTRFTPSQLDKDFIAVRAAIITYATQLETATVKKFGAEYLQNIHLRLPRQFVVPRKTLPSLTAKIR